MWELITAPQNSIFGIAIMLMLLLGILELASFMLGGINEWVDGFLPDSLTDTQAEIGLNYADTGVVIRFLSWLYVWGSDNICINKNKKIWREKMR